MFDRLRILRWLIPVLLVQVGRALGGSPAPPPAPRDEMVVLRGGTLIDGTGAERGGANGNGLAWGATTNGGQPTSAGVAVDTSTPTVPPAMSSERGAAGIGAPDHGVAAALGDGGCELGVATKGSAGEALALASTNIVPLIPPLGSDCAGPVDGARGSAFRGPASA